MKKLVLVLFVVLALFQSCSSDDDGGSDTSGTNIPSVDEVITGTEFSRGADGDYADYINNYSTLFTRNNASTVSFSGQTTRLQQTKEIGGNLKTTTPVADIQLEFEGQDGLSAGFSDESLNGTTKIVRSKTSSSLGLFNKTNESGQGLTNVSVIDGYISSHADVLANWSTAASAGVAGNFDDEGTTRYVTAKGIELDQAFTKTMSGALAYDQAVNQYLNRLDDEGDGTNTYRTANDEFSNEDGYTTMEHHWDESFGYIYGNITGENLIFKYIDNVDALAKFSGVEGDILEAYVAGRIAISEKDYTTRDEQVSILREKLGLIIAVRAVNYLGSGADLIGDLAEGDAGRTVAFHDLSEGYGFVNSLRYVVDAVGTPYFTDAEVDAFLDILDADNGFWSVTDEELLDMADDIAAKSVGGLSWVYSDVR